MKEFLLNCNVVGKSYGIIERYASLHEGIIRIE
jgi:hypothetical protein